MHERKAAGNRLEVNIVFKKDVYDFFVLLKILRQRSVFELHHVDTLLEDLALDQPVDFGNVEFADGV